MFGKIFVIELLCTLVLMYHVAEAQNTDSGLDIIVPESVKECVRSFDGKPISPKAALVACLQDWAWALQQEIEENITSNTEAELNENFAFQEPNRWPNSRFRVKRREYRTLTPNERYRFHNALDNLYWNGTIHKFARIHKRAAGVHHGGPSFLPWHRVLLAMFEEELRAVDPTVFLPYFDSSIDDAMDNPVNSMLWTSKYFGNAIGAVKSGFAAGWVTDTSYLERNYGRKGSRGSTLMKKHYIDQVLTRCSLSEILKPTAAKYYNFETFHGGAHMWIGGDMSGLDTAGYDPLFYMHHAYVDYIWEMFRENQKRFCGVDPEYDYPNTAQGTHAPNMQMIGFPEYTNVEGIQDYWTRDWYTYDSHPKCPDCCPGCEKPVPMYCDQRRWICVASSRRVRVAGAESFAGGEYQEPAKPTIQMDSEELAAIAQPLVERNRGDAFDAPPSDGRTLATAASDALKANYTV